VTFDAHMQPSWNNTSLEYVSDICEVDKDLIASLVEDNKLLMKEILQLTKSIYLENPYNTNKVVNENFKIYKQDIRHLLSNQAGEREFHTLLKTDLSLIAEIYADPKDEFICFSEFPIYEKRADFVLFTGRSKMSVFIIEVKGADFLFSNKGTYRKLNEKLNICRHQVVETINQITRYQYNEFREFCHNIRLNVENGEDVYNSQMGSKKYLEVDPKKEINIFGVVIGGQTRDDLYESKLRYNEENIASKIKIESWNSWLNKLSRP